jgi:hypothetical protein
MQVIGDTYFRGVNELVDPASLAEGYVSYAKNKRFIEGRAVDRGGHLRTVWTNLDTDPTTSVSPAGTVFGLCEYVDATGGRFGILFHATSASLVKAGRHRRVLAYPAGVTITQPMNAVQADSAVYAFIGDGITPMSWDGVGDFVLVDQSETGNSFIRMPKGRFGIYYYDRLWVGFGDSLFPSLASDITLFDPVNEIPVGRGENDFLTGAYPFNQNSIVAVKRRSVYAVASIDGTLSNTIVEKVGDIVGSEARDGVLTDGALMWLPTTSGIYSINQAFETRLQAASTSLAKNVEKSYRGINAAGFARMAGIGFSGYYYWACPSSGSAVNDRVFCYSLENREWCGFDENATDYDVAGWLRLDVGGEIKLCGVSKSGYIFIYAEDTQLAEGANANADNPVTTEMITRGYALPVYGAQANLGFEVNIKTINAKYSIYSRYDGVNEERAVVVDEVKDPTKYTVIGKRDYRLDNALLDFEDPYREDYRLIANDSGFLLDTTAFVHAILDEEGQPILDESESIIYDEGTGTDTSSIDLDHRQDFRHGVRNTRASRYTQLRFVNKRGGSELIAVKSLAKPNGRSAISKQTL